MHGQREPWMDECRRDERSPNVEGKEDKNGLKRPPNLVGGKSPGFQFKLDSLNLFYYLSVVVLGSD